MGLKVFSLLRNGTRHLYAPKELPELSRAVGGTLPEMLAGKAKGAIGEVATFSQTAKKEAEIIASDTSKAVTEVTKEAIGNKLFNISKIEVIPNANKRALTEAEYSASMEHLSRKMVMNLFQPTSEFALSNYSHPDEYIKSVSKILENAEGLEYKEFISILENLSKQLEELAISTAKELPLAEGMNELGDTIYRYQAAQNIKEKQSILKKIIQEMKAENIKNNESFSNYFERLYAKVKQIPKEKIKVKYSDIDIPPEKIILTNEEKEEFKKICLENNSSFNPRLTPDMSYEEIADHWCELRVSDYVSTAESIGTTKMQAAALQQLPRYEAEIMSDGQVKPLVRWLHTCPESKPLEPSYPLNMDYQLPGWEKDAARYKKNVETYHKRLERWKTYDTDKYVDETFKIGEIYSYPKMQSTSTSLTWSEGVFRDDNPGMNIKFIIHPKSRISKAYNMGSKSIGDGEAVYLPDTKFTVLDKRVERAEDTVGNIFYRHIIEMQEL